MRFVLTTDLAIQIEKHIDAICAERPISDEHAHRIASKDRALPLLRGMDGYCVLSLTGDVLEYDWRHFEEPVPLSPYGRAYGAIVFGARKYPELQALIPVRAAGDAACRHCEGTGRHPLANETSDERVMCECGGLGFVPSVRPDGEPAPPPYTGSVFPDITPSSFRSSFIYQIVADHDVKTAEQFAGLVATMYEEPEHEFVYYRPKDRSGNKFIDEALVNGTFAESEIEFFHYLREENGRNFVRVERHESDDSGAEIVFAYEKRNVLWMNRVTAGEMYTKRNLVLSTRVRRAMDLDRQTDRNPIEIKPGAFGLSVDILKLWPMARRWFLRWRHRVKPPERR